MKTFGMKGRGRERRPPGEIVEIGWRIEELEKPAAKERMREAGRVGGEGSGKLPDPSLGQTRDKVAAALGVSGHMDK